MPTCLLCPKGLGMAINALILVWGCSFGSIGPAKFPAFTSVARASAIFLQSSGSVKKFLHLVILVPGGPTPEFAPFLSCSRTDLSRGIAAWPMVLLSISAILDAHSVMLTLGTTCSGNGKCGNLEFLHSSSVIGLSCGMGGQMTSGFLGSQTLFLTGWRGTKLSQSCRTLLQYEVSWSGGRYLQGVEVSFPLSERKQEN